MAALCEGADVVVHEATLEDDRIEDAKQKGHSTPGVCHIMKLRQFFFLVAKVISVNLFVRLHTVSNA